MPACQLLNRAPRRPVWACRRRRDRARRPVRQLDHQQQHAIEPLEGPGGHQPPRQGLDDKTTAHIGRHTFVNELIRGGEDLVLVAEIAGHARVETLRVYGVDLQRNWNAR